MNDRQLPTADPPAADPQRRLFRRGFALVALPLLALAVPLFWHRSPSPAWGGYSRSYALGLAVVITGSLVLGLLAGARCRKQGNHRAALKVVLAIGTLVTACLLAEIALRVTAPDLFFEYQRKWGNTKSLVFGFEADRNYSWTAADARYKTDRFGFRVNVNTPDWSERRQASAAGTGARPAGGPLVFALGESSVFGYGLNDNETWPHLLETKLSQEGRPVTVVNAANSGHISLQALLRLHLRIAPHKPDYLLCYLGRNDVSREARPRDTIGLEENVAFSDTFPCYVRLEHAGQNLYCRSLLYHHLTYTLPKYLLRKVLGERAEHIKEELRQRHGGRPSLNLRTISEVYDLLRHPPPPSGQTNAATEAALAHNGALLRDNLRAMVDICKRNDIRLVLVTFLCDKQRIEPYVRRGIEHHNEVLRQVAREEGLPLVDLEPAFATVGGAEKYFFEDRYHPSRAGAEYIATALAAAFPQWAAPASGRAGELKAGSAQMPAP